MFDFIPEQEKSSELANKIKNEGIIPYKNRFKILNLLYNIDDNGLTDDEIVLVTKELEYYKELERLKILYNSNRDKFGDKINEELDELISSYEEQDYLLKSKDLDGLSKKISKNLFLNQRSDIPFIRTGETYRDFIKKHIDFKGSLEKLSETDFIKDFYNIFVISYRKYIENRDDTTKLNSTIDGLDLDRLELIKVINITVEELHLLYNKKLQDLDNKKLQLLKKKEYEKLSSTLIFSLKNGEQLTQDIKAIDTDSNNVTKTINPKKNLLKKETITPTPQILQETNTSKPLVKETNTSKPLVKETNTPKSLIKKTSNNEISNNRIQKLQSQIELLEAEIKKEKDLVKKGEKGNNSEDLNVKISQLRRLMVAEEFESFKLSEFIENEGMPQSIIDIFDVLAKRYISEYSPIFDDQNKDKKNYNLKSFLNFVLKIESFGGKNIPNLNGSGAEGFYQLHTKNSGIGYVQVIKGKSCEISKDDFLKLQEEDKNRTDIMETYKTNSYETSIRSTINFFRILGKELKEGKEGNIGSDITYSFTGRILNLSIRSGEDVLKKYNFVPGNQVTPPKIYKIEGSEEIVQDVLDLGVIEQTLLFLCDAFGRGEKQNSDTKKYISNIILGDKDQLREFYNYFHNTDSKQYDGTALNLINSVLEKTNLKEIT